jgi:hypothetical protein
LKIIDPGHKYSLHCLDGSIDQTLTFVKREGSGYPGNEGSYLGTTCQEVLRALVDRCEYLGNQIPCWQTFLAKKLLVLCLWLFEQRHAKKSGKTVRFKGIMAAPTCVVCGHIFCEKHDEGTV